MRTAIFAAVAALGLSGTFVAANAQPAYPPPYGYAPYPYARAQAVCPPGYYWSARHYDKWGRLWPRGCTPDGF